MAADDQELIVLQESRPHVARAGAWQSRTDHIHLKHGQDKAPLVLKLINGAEGRQPITDLQVELDRKPFLTMKDFAGSNTLTRDVTGQLKAGDNLLTVKCFGPSGARLAWNLLTSKVVITRVSPDPFTLKDSLVVEGRNFSDNLKSVSATIAGKPVEVASATSNQLQLKLPSNLHGGKSKLVVKVNGVKSNEFIIAVRSNPHLDWIDFVATAPGQPVTIHGKGFSKNAADNEVTFRSVRARITSASEDRISCIVPEMHFPDWHVPITVTTFGMPSKGKLTINIDVRVVPNEGVPMK